MKRFLAVGFAVLALALSVIVLDAPAKFSRPIFSIPNTVTHFLTKLKTSFFEAYDPAQSPDVSLVGVSNHHATSSSTHTLPTSGAAVTQAVADPEALGAMTSAADLAQLQTLVNQTFQSYIATRKLIGPQGSQGPQGIQGPQGPPGSAGSIQTFGSGGNSNDTSGTILGVTELSARDLTVSNNTALNNLTVSGSFNASSLNLTNALTVSNGGTGDSTLAADGILYGNGTSGIGVTTAGNLGDCLQSNGAGNAPTFGSCTAGGARWDQLLNPNTNLALFMTANTTTLTYGNATGVGTNLFNLTDTASNTGTGYLLNLSTAASSTLNPLQVVAAGRTALTVDAGGNVGIGTNSPVSVLEVNQSSAAKNSVMILSTTGPIIAPRLVFNRYSSGQPADNNMWDFIFGNISFAGRVVNDSDTVASSWISATRTGLKVNDVTFFGGNVRIGTAVFATANLEVNGSQPASSDGANGANIGNTLIIDKVTGGDTSVVSTGAGGNGSAISVSSGNGGQALSAGTASTGGGAGTITLQGGTGGAAAVAGTGNNTGGTGGPFTWTAGTGGAATGATSGNNTGGNGGAVSLQGGTGGAANAGTGNLVGGTGGSVTISGGTGGVGLTSGGNGGLTTIQGGTAAAMAGAAGGGVTLTGKAGSSTGAGGAGGTLTLTAGAAGGNNSVNRAGGAISLTVGASRAVP
jgi:hypothetical protein